MKKTIIMSDMPIIIELEPPPMSMPAMSDEVAVGEAIDMVMLAMLVGRAEVMSIEDISIPLIVLDVFVGVVLLLLM